MIIRCPVCESEATLHVAQRDADRPGLEIIHCPECGWFERPIEIEPERAWSGPL